MPHYKSMGFTPTAVHFFVSDSLHTLIHFIYMVFLQRLIPSLGPGFFEEAGHLLILVFLFPFDMRFFNGFLADDGAISYEGFLDPAGSLCGDGFLAFYGELIMEDYFLFLVNFAYTDYSI